MANQIMAYFEYSHLPERLQNISKPIGDLAKLIDGNLPDCAEKTAGLRKLLEAKDCFVRAGLPTDVPTSPTPADAPQPFGPGNPPVNA
jgi:hypothetical protein